jgi:hypothetical protein
VSCVLVDVVRKDWYPPSNEQGAGACLRDWQTAFAVNSF